MATVTTCPICLLDVTNGTRLPFCGHEYCLRCIAYWVCSRFEEAALKCDQDDENQLFRDIDGMYCPTCRAPIYPITFVTIYVEYHRVYDDRLDDKFRGIAVNKRDV